MTDTDWAEIAHPVQIEEKGTSENEFKLDATGYIAYEASGGETNAIRATMNTTIRLPLPRASWKPHLSDAGYLEAGT